MSSRVGETVAGLRVVALGVGAALVYGVAHDQVTARICVEYFTIGHPRIIRSTSPTALAFAWGVVATWWAGLFLGSLLALGATRGPRRRRSARSLVRPVALLLACMAAASLLAGSVGFLLAKQGVVVLTGPIATLVPESRHARFMANVWAHNAAYLTALVGGIALTVRVWRARRTADAAGATSPSLRGGLRRGG